MTGKLALSKNKLIYSKNNKKITDKFSDKFTHYLRYRNDSILITHKTLNKDNPKLNCRLKNLSQYSPKRIILDNLLETKTSSYIFKTSNKKYTIIFYYNADKYRVNLFKKKGINLIKSKLINNTFFDLQIILQKLYLLGCRNLLVEGGNILTNSFLKKNMFNNFYLFKSKKKLSKNVEHIQFKSFKLLSQKYKNKSKINNKFGKDIINLYKNSNV